MPPSILSLFPELERDIQAFYTTGILPYQEIKALVEAGHIRAAEPVTEAQLQPASLDLRLGDIAYKVRASFLPTGTSRVMSKIQSVKMQEIDLSNPSVLERGSVYIVPLAEELHLPQNVLGKANPKSTIGRLDVFTRLITDYGGEFERVPRGYTGKLYAEIAPRTFSIMVHAGTRMNQIRFMRGNPPPSDSALTALNESETLVYLDGAPGRAEIAKGLWISIDLKGGAEDGLLGYRAKNNPAVIDLDNVNAYDPEEFWEPIRKQRRQQLVLQPGDFYILASREKIRVPPRVAAEMVGYDPTVGEFRIHYAGFFDPGFGYGSNDVLGTRAVLEVRSHEVPFLLQHGQRVGRLIYERLRESPQKVYGASIGSSYQSQEIALSKQFKRSSQSTNEGRA